MADEAKTRTEPARVAWRSRLPGRGAGGEGRSAKGPAAPAAPATGHRDLRGGARSLRGTLRGAGRVALWALIALLLVRGLDDVLSGSLEHAASSPVEPASAFTGDEARAFAVAFARVYISSPSAGALGPYLAPGLADRLRAPTAPGGARVAQGAVAGARPLGADQALVTVACQLATNRILYLAVPMARDRSGSLSVFDLPSFVAPPPTGHAEAEVGEPIGGPGSAEIRRLAQRFLAAYLSGGRAGELSYLVAPGTAIAPVGRGLHLAGVTGVEQPGSGSTAAPRAVVVRARVRDAASAATYPVAYRLELVRRDRWYVAGVEGALR